MKIVVNRRFGGFSLSESGYNRYLELSGKPYKSRYDMFSNVERTDPFLIQVVEELGSEASGEHASLQVVEIPDDVDDWYIDEYDGYETIREALVCIGWDSVGMGRSW